MKKFILKIARYYIPIFGALLFFKFIYDFPREKAVKAKTEATYLKWTGFQNKESIDVIFVGSSRVYCSVNPQIFDSISGLHSYNLGTGNQSIVESYYYTKQALESNKKIKIVVVDLFDRCFRMVDHMHLNNNTKYLSAENSISLQLSVDASRAIYNKLFPLLEDVGYLSPDIFLSAFTQSTELQKTSRWIEGFELSTESGSANYAELESRCTAFQKQKIRISNERLEYLNRIITLCKNSKVKLIFTCIPETICRKEYEINFFKKYLNDLGYSLFYEYPQLNSSDIRKDNFHTNSMGAKKCSEYLAKFVRDNYQ